VDVQIRRASAEDAEALADLLREVGYFARINQEPPETTRERVARHLALAAADRSHSIYVAQGPQGVILGYGAVHWLPYLILAGPEGYVSELFLREAARGQGTGRQLLEVIKAEAVERGCARLNLLNRRDRESYQRQFYAKQGWEEREDMANFVYLFS
jgi:GNAT superfamily N-acetyltransferase